MVQAVTMPKTEWESWSSVSTPGGVALWRKAFCMLLLVSPLGACSTLPSQQAHRGVQPALKDWSADAAEKTDGSITDQQLGACSESKTALCLPDHPKIAFWARRFSEDNRAAFQSCFYRAEKYAKDVRKIFDEQRVPKDLVYLAIVESGFSPTARSPAKAVGMWQFIPATGKRFGLEQNRWIDERRHPFKAARAAADYLSFLYDTFGSWPLALAAYNAGERTVQAALDRSGLKTFWELSEAGFLPAETRDYVPKVYAAVKISTNPQYYGFYFDPEKDDSDHEIVAVPGGIKLSSLARHMETSESVLRDHNPELCQPTTPPGSLIYALCVPPGKGETVQSALAELQATQKEPPKSMGKGSLGLKQTAYRTDSTGFSIRSAGKFVSEGKKPIRAAARSCTLLPYPVRQGDTLWSVAQRFRTTVDTLNSHNDLTQSRKLMAGSVLTICTSEHQVASTKKWRTD